jgi:hypothetical protein
MSPKHTATRALAAGLAAAALGAPPALADDLRSPDARDAATAQAQQRAHTVTGGVRAPDLRTPDARDAATPVAQTAAARTPDAPTVVEITHAEGFDWTSAAIGAAGGIALALIATAATATVAGRSRPAPH